VSAQRLKQFGEEHGLHEAQIATAAWRCQAVDLQVAEIDTILHSLRAASSDSMLSTLSPLLERSEWFAGDGKAIADRVRESLSEKRTASGAEAAIKAVEEALCAQVVPQWKESYQYHHSHHSACEPPNGLDSVGIRTAVGAPMERSCRQEAMERLTRDGYCILHNALTPEDVAACSEASFSHFRASIERKKATREREIHGSRGGGVNQRKRRGQEARERDFVETATNRWHLNAFGTEGERVLLPRAGAWMPLVHRFFQETMGGYTPAACYQSELQVKNSVFPDRRLTPAVSCWRF